MRVRLLIDHPAVKWFLLLVSIATIMFGALQYQGNLQQQELVELERVWLKQDQQWNADIVDSHAEIITLITERCGEEETHADTRPD